MLEQTFPRRHGCCPLPAGYHCFTPPQWGPAPCLSALPRPSFAPSLFFCCVLAGWRLHSEAHEKLPVSTRRARYLVLPPRVRTVRMRLGPICREGEGSVSTVGF